MLKIILSIKNKKVRKTPIIRYNKQNIRSIVETTERINGAADGTRTRTVSLPGDFKSPVSTDSTTAAAGDYDTIFLFYRQDCFGEDGNHCFAEMTDRNFNVFCILSVDMLNQMCYNIPQECHLTEEKL